MPSFSIVRESHVPDSFRVKSVKGQFDLSVEKIRETFEGSIDIENANWNIGAIIGRSGTGKSTIAQELFGDDYIRGYDYSNRAIVDDMPEDATLEDVFRTFHNVGFASPPSWLKPYAVLSTGEKMRVDIARSILSGSELIVFDEFTSVVDRTIAQVGSASIAKAIRKTNRKFIAVTCHYDIVDWLCPDWVYSTDTHEFKWCDKKKDQKSSSTSFELRERGRFLQSITI